jgi:hypothetical protein
VNRLDEGTSARADRRHGTLGVEESYMEHDRNTRRRWLHDLTSFAKTTKPCMLNSALFTTLP